MGVTVIDLFILQISPINCGVSRSEGRTRRGGRILHENRGHYWFLGDLGGTGERVVFPELRSITEVKGVRIIQISTKTC